MQLRKKHKSKNKLTVEQNTQTERQTDRKYPMWEFFRQNVLTERMKV
jgi:hypothetical protein